MYSVGHLQDEVILKRIIRPPIGFHFISHFFLPAVDKQRDCVTSTDAKSKAAWFPYFYSKLVKERSSLVQTAFMGGSGLKMHLISICLKLLYQITDLGHDAAQ